MAKIRTSEKNNKKDIIQTEAVKLFREKGYRAASMRDLAAKVGVEAASLYNHIQSKNELLNNICFEVAKNFTSNIEEVENDKLPVIQKIEKLLRFHVHEMVHNYEQVYVSEREWRNMDEPDLGEYRELRRSYRKRFATIVQQGIDKKELKAIDGNTAVMIFLNAINAVDQWHRIIHKVDSRDLEDQMIAILIEGVKK
jgi:AcrR family transcriptional regulator